MNGGRRSNLFLFEHGPDGNIVMRTGPELQLPQTGDLEAFSGLVAGLGTLDFGREGGDIWAELYPGTEMPEGFEPTSRRSLPGILGYDYFMRAGTAFQLAHWSRTNRFCGACGEAMLEDGTVRAMVCPACGQMSFPSLSPAVIVAVEKEGCLLLGHNAAFPAGRYSVLAGFVEPGESLEEAVCREVYEESGVNVRDVRYFGSQPWPFPNSLMVGFCAEWESGDLKPDGTELTDVGWFSPDTLPDIPPSVSISRRLIDDWLCRRA